jgi:hypothetical protein
MFDVGGWGHAVRVKRWGEVSTGGQRGFIQVIYIAAVRRVSFVWK